MTLDAKRGAEKKAEVETIIGEALRSLPGADREAFAAAILAEYVAITPPEAPPVVIELITMRSYGRGGAVSTKPGNIVLDLRKLAVSLAGGVLTFAGIGQSPWMAFLAALVVWDSLWSGLKVAISEREAIVVWTMWLDADDGDTVPRSTLRRRVNEELEGSGKPSMASADFEQALATLLKMRCIERSQKDDTRWWLREWVSIDYR